MKIFTVIGARPQFIKAAPLTRAIEAFNQTVDNKLSQTIIHTGQHYDENMSDVFFKELGLPVPKYSLAVGSGTHAEQTGKIMKALELIVIDEKPGCILVYGDTNSTLAAALVAAKLNVPLMHVEAGLRSKNRRMPEELNRIITDKLSSLLFCPTQEAVKNLSQEGIIQGVYMTGDVMVDQLYYAAETLSEKLFQGEYIFLTLHRQETCDSSKNLKEILFTLNKISHNIPIIFPIHPRMKKVLKSIDVEFSSSFRIIEPLGYKDAINCIKNARLVLTDSGGIQKEAYILKTPCITLRTETEWVETLDFGWNRLAGLSAGKLNGMVSETLSFNKLASHPDLYGKGDAAEKIVTLISTKIGIK